MTQSSPLSDPGIVPDPYPVYAELAEREPVHWCEELGAWAVLKYADCAGALTNPRFRAERMEEILAVKYPGESLPPGSIYHRFTRNVMMYTDPPRHDALRRSTRGAFTPDAHRHYSRVIERVAAELVAAIPSRTTEIEAVYELAAPLPVNAAVRAFGVPEEDLEFVVPRVNTLMTYWSGPQGRPVALDRLLELLADLHTYCLELLQGARGQVAADTVIARLAADQGERAECTREQAVHQLVLLLIALFAPTTPGSASSGMLAFARNPRQKERFLRDGACAGNAPDEIVRYNASNQFTWRVAAAEVEMGGVRIEEGQSVALFLGAANRDAEVFERPGSFDLARSNSARHLSFGLGPHSCLGRQIACLELKWFFAALLARFPGIRPAGEPEWNPNLEFRSLSSLPLSLN